MNADGILNNTAFNGYNVFAYCLNNPVIFSDPSGYYTVSIPAVGEGPITIVAAPNENVTVSKSGNTYYASCTSNNKKGNVYIASNKDEPDHPDYKPPKRGSRVVKNPNGQGNGWLAKDGGIWVWTPGMHGGDGWTVQYPNGKHKHAYPGGGVRSHYKLQQDPIVPVIKTAVGVTITIVLIADNATGIGMADDAFIAAGLGCAVNGISDLFGEQICTECGEVYYGF